MFVLWVIKLLMNTLISWLLLMITSEKFGHIFWKWRIRCSICSNNFTSLLKGRLGESWSTYRRTMGVNIGIFLRNIINRMVSDWRRWYLRCHSRMGLLRINRMIYEKIKSMLSHAKQLKTFWGEALMTVVHVINLSPSYALKGDIPQRVEEKIFRFDRIVRMWFKNFSIPVEI